MSSVNASSARYCFIDLDFGNHRNKLGTCAAFVDATDARYGFSSKDLRLLGGSELSRIHDLIAADHGKKRMTHHHARVLTQWHLWFPVL